MAQKSFPWTNSGTGDGTSGGYTALEWSEIWRQAFLGGLETTGGVLKGAGNELACTGTATPIAVNTGAAFVYGKFYQNTASVNLSVTTPVVGTTGGHVILQLDWTAQTVRLVATRNTDGVNSTPSLTQSTSTQWEIRLASFTVTTLGVIALTDTRAYAHFSERINKGNVDGMTTGRIPFGTSAGVLSEDSNLFWDNTNKRLGLGTTSPSINLDIAGSAAEARILASATAGGAAFHLRNNDGSPSYYGYINFENSAGTAKGQVAYEVAGQAMVFSAAEAERMRLTSTGLGIGDASPDYALDVVGQVEVSPGSALPPLVLGGNAQGQRVDGLHADEIDTLDFMRQGGNATTWATNGTTDYTPTSLRMQAGVVRFASIPGTSASTFAITFPEAFSATPLIYVTIMSNTAYLTTSVVSPTSSGCNIGVGNAGASTQNNIDAAWLAIGPR